MKGCCVWVQQGSNIFIPFLDTSGFILSDMIFYMNL